MDLQHWFVEVQQKRRPLQSVAVVQKPPSSAFVENKLEQHLLFEQQNNEPLQSKMFVQYCPSREVITLFQMSTQRGMMFSQI